MTQFEKVDVHFSQFPGDKIGAMKWNLSTRLKALRVLHDEKATSSNPANSFDWHNERLAIAQANQIKQFAAKFPDRIIHPEILRQVDYMRENRLLSAVDVVRIAERLERAVKNPAYWEKISDVHAARLWHSDGVLYARENGIRTGRVVGPLDAKTCPVCRHMLGLLVDLNRYAAKIKRSLKKVQPDAFLKTWRFPRLEDVDNMSREELRAKGLSLPPFHEACRCSIAWRSARAM
jgi:hypothetical protein